MRSFTTIDLQYAHRFYGFKGEAQYLHGHTGVLTIEVEDTIVDGVNMVFPCNEIKKTAWSVLQNFDHALILREDDPLLPAILDVYEKQGIKNGAPTNKQKGPAFKTELATAYPECRPHRPKVEDAGQLQTVRTTENSSISYNLSGGGGGLGRGHSGSWQGDGNHEHDAEKK